jgi:hypothetical protein
MLFPCVNYERGCRGRTWRPGGRCSDCVVRLCCICYLAITPSNEVPPPTGITPLACRRWPLHDTPGGAIRRWRCRYPTPRDSRQSGLKRLSQVGASTRDSLCISPTQERSDLVTAMGANGATLISNAEEPPQLLHILC